MHRLNLDFAVFHETWLGESHSIQSGNLLARCDSVPKICDQGVELKVGNLSISAVYLKKGGLEGTVFNKYLARADLSSPHLFLGDLNARYKLNRFGACANYSCPRFPVIQQKLEKKGFLYEESSLEGFSFWNRALGHKTRPDHVFSRGVSAQAWIAQDELGQDHFPIVVTAQLEFYLPEDYYRWSLSKTKQPALVQLYRERVGCGLPSRHRTESAADFVERLERHLVETARAVFPTSGTPFHKRKMRKYVPSKNRGVEDVQEPPEPAGPLQSPGAGGNCLDCLEELA